MMLEKKIENLLKSFTEEMKKRDDRIEKLEKDVLDLKRNVTKLEEKIDDAEAYELRDAAVISGDSLPAVIVGENINELTCRMIREKIKLS